MAHTVLGSPFRTGSSSLHWLPGERISAVGDLKKVYLSGPMTGIEDHNFPAFKYTQKAIQEAHPGLVVISPTDMHPETEVFGSKPVPAKDYGFYIIEDLKMMLSDGCEGIVLLPGWSKSNGAKIELDLALKLGWRIFRWSHQGGSLQEIG